MRHNQHSRDLSFGTAAFSAWHPVPFSSWHLFNTLPFVGSATPASGLESTVGAAGPPPRPWVHPPSLQQSQEGQAPQVQPSLCQALPVSLPTSLGSQSIKAFDFLILPCSQQKAKCSPGTWPGFCGGAEMAEEGRQQEVSPSKSSRAAASHTMRLHTPASICPSFCSSEARDIK